MVCQESKVKDIVEGLVAIDQDSNLPKSVRIKIKRAIDILEEDQQSDFSIKIDRSLQELGDIAEDPNLPQHARMQIWSVVSLLESE